MRLQRLGVELLFGTGLAAINGTDGKATSVTLSNGETPEAVSFSPEVEPTSDSPNGNGVSIEQESALLAENGLDYQALTEMLGAHDETIRAAMGIG